MQTSLSTSLKATFPEIEARKYSLEDVNGNISRSKGLDFRVFPTDLDNPVHIEQLCTPEECSIALQAMWRAHTTKQSWMSLVFRPSAGRITGPNQKSRNSYSVREEIPELATLYAKMDAAAETAKEKFGTGFPALRKYQDQALIYLPGGFFTAHTDDSISTGPVGNQHWERNQPQRQLAGLLYLNDNFEGGALQFTNWISNEDGQRLTIKPKAGMFILFPAHPWFRHQVLKTSNGIRFAISRWWTVFNSSTV